MSQDPLSDYPAPDAANPAVAPFPGDAAAPVEAPPVWISAPEPREEVPLDSLLEQESSSPRFGRLVSVDVYRGFVMFLMMAELLHLANLAEVFTQGFWGNVAQWLKFHTSHVEWVGCSLHDMIQPSFSFLVGVALVLSLARRKKYQPPWKTAVHVLWRSLLLVLLGVFLRSVDAERTYWTFEDTLTQIGLGYPVLYVLALCPRKVQWSAFGVIIVGYWLAFLLYPAPPANFDWRAVGVGPEWVHQTGLAAHWDKNCNAAWAFDQWFLNLFPRETAFTHNEGGYATLSFIPTLGTMLLGLLAGGVLQNDHTPWRKVGWLALAGVIGMVLGYAWNLTNTCPMVKRIWTPSWTLFSGGACFLYLAFFFIVVEIFRFRAWAFPLVVLGMNSIAAYMIAHLWPAFIQRNFHTHFGPVFKGHGPLEATFNGLIVFAILWLCLLWMYRKRVFLKI